MDVAWMRSGDVTYSGEALVLACLLHVKKPSQRTDAHEEEIKEVLKVYGDTEGPKKTTKARKTTQK